MMIKNILFLLCFGALQASFLLFGELPAAQPHPAFRLMTFNIRRDGKEKEKKNLWQNRKNRVFDVIQENAPSILCLQEATINQINDIAQKFPNYAWVGTGRGERYFGLAKDEHTPIFYDMNRFELQDHGTFSINKGSANPFRWKKKGMLPRITTWIFLKDKATQESFFVYNTHLDHDYDAVRQKGMDKIFKQMWSMQGPEFNISDHFIFLVGDFNTNLTTPIKLGKTDSYTTYEKEFSEKRFVDTRKIAQTVSGPYNTATDWNGKEKYSIDHILLRPSVKNEWIDDEDLLIIHLTYPIIETHATVQEKNSNLLPSDHRPVMITVLPTNPYVEA